MHDRNTIVLPGRSTDRVGMSARPLFPRGGRVVLGLVAAAFAYPHYQLMRFAAGSDLYSYILLIPCVSAYIAWTTIGRAEARGEPFRGLGMTLLAAGLVLLAATLLASNSATEDRLALTTAAFVLALAGTCAWFLHRSALRALFFPLGFLAFMIPLPTAVLHRIETFMQHGSAIVAHGLFDLAGTPVFYEQLIFQLPGINLHVAPECSGIRSTLVLLIVSVLTGYFFLRAPRYRALLALAVVPLALARNGFRIFVIGEMCVRLGPQMIDSILHRRGGPVFFGLSLIPLFLLLLILQRLDRRRAS